MASRAAPLSTMLERIGGSRRARKQQRAQQREQLIQWR
jgi:hypothetical protein